MTRTECSSSGFNSSVCLRRAPELSAVLNTIHPAEGFKPPPHRKALRKHFTWAALSFHLILTTNNYFNLVRHLRQEIPSKDWFDQIIFLKKGQSSILSTNKSVVRQSSDISGTFKHFRLPLISKQTSAYKQSLTLKAHILGIIQTLTCINLF